LPYAHVHALFRVNALLLNSCPKQHKSFSAFIPTVTEKHWRMARGGHGLPKVSPGPAMLDPITSCGWAIPKMVLRLFQGWHARKAGGLQPSSFLLDTPRRTPMLKKDGEFRAAVLNMSITINQSISKSIA
jgi:hypothetical protein